MNVAATATTDRVYHPTGETYQVTDMGQSVAKAILRGMKSGDNSQIISMLDILLETWKSANHCEDPDPFNDLQTGPGHEDGVDWAEVEFYDQNSTRIYSTKQLADLLDGSKVRLTKWIAANLRVMADHRVSTQYAVEAALVRSLGRNPQASDQGAILELRGL